MLVIADKLISVAAIEVSMELSEISGNMLVIIGKADEGAAEKATRMDVSESHNLKFGSFAEMEHRSATGPEVVAVVAAKAEEVASKKP